MEGCGKARMCGPQGGCKDGPVADAFQAPAVVGPLRKAMSMTSRDRRRREMGLVASYLRDLRQQARAATGAVVGGVAPVARDVAATGATAARGARREVHRRAQ